MPNIVIRWADNTAELRRNLAEGLDTINATRAGADSMAKALGGTNLLAAANNFAAAIQQIGGVSKLTASEQEKWHGILDKAIQKYEALGQVAPTALRELRDATAQSTQQGGGMLQWLEALGHSWAARVAEGMLLRDAIRSVIDKVGEMARALPELALRGAAVADVEENFQRLTTQAGLLGETLMGTLREGTHNTVTNFELMKSVNQDLAAGMNLTTAQFGTLARGAFALAQATGTDVKTAFDTMNDAMLTGRTRALALLTGKIDLQAAEEQYARSLGTTTEHLTDEAKLQAARMAILDSVSRATARLGEQTDGLDEKVAQAEVAWENFKEELGKEIALSPTLLAGLDGIQQAIAETFGSSQQEAIHQIVTAIDTGAIALVGFAEVALNTARVVGTGWDGMKLAVSASLSLMAEAALLAVRAYQGLQNLNAATTFGETSRAFAQSAQSAKLLADQLQGMQQSFHADAEAALHAITSHTQFDETIDRGQQALATLRSKMEAARQSTADFVGPINQVAAGQERAAGAAEHHGDQIKQTSEEVKKYETAIRNVTQAQQNEFRSLDTLSDALIDQIIQQSRNKASWEDLKAVYHLTDVQVEALKDTIKLNTDVLKIETVSTQLHSGALEQLGEKRNDEVLAIQQTQAARERLNSARVLDITTLQNLGTVEVAWIDHLAQERLRILGLIDVMEQQARVRQLNGAGLTNVGTPVNPVPPEVTAGIERAEKAAQDTRAAFDDLGNTFVRLAQVSQGSMGIVLQSVGRTIVGLNGALQQSHLTGINGAELGGRFGYLSTALNSNATTGQRIAGGVAAGAAATQGAMDVWSATESHRSAAGNAGAGALAGAQAGAAFGPYGVAIGAAAGLVVGIVRGQPEWSHAAEEIGHDFGRSMGEAVSQEFGQHIADQAHEMFHGSRQASEIFNLSGIVQQGGGVTAQNVDQLTMRLRDTFSMLQTGLFSIQQAQQVVEENFGNFVQANTDRLGFLSDNMRQIIQLDRTMGTNTQAVTDYLMQQGGVAIAAANGIIGAYAQDFERFSTIRGQIEDLSQALADPRLIGQERIDKQHQLNDLLGQQASLAGENKDRLETLGVVALGTFSAAVASGQSYTAALLASAPALGTLSQGFEDLGLSSDNAAVRILMLQGHIATNTPELVRGVDGLTGSFAALSNMGLLDIDTFHALQTTGQDMYNRLSAAAVANGATSEEAQRSSLLQMQDYLHGAEQAAHDLGVPLDDNTQSLIDQSHELGIWHDKGKDSAGELLTGINDLKSAVEDLGRALRGLPPLVRTEVHTDYTSSGQPSAPQTTVEQPPSDSAEPPPGVSTGGLVRAFGIQRFADGGIVLPFPFRGIGTDTQLAALTPGELIMNQAQQGHIAGDLVAGQSAVVSAQEQREALAALTQSVQKTQADQRDLMLSLPRVVARAVRDQLQVA